MLRIKPISQGKLLVRVRFILGLIVEMINGNRDVVNFYGSRVRGGSSGQGQGGDTVCASSGGERQEGSGSAASKPHSLVYFLVMAIYVVVVLVKIQTARGGFKLLI